MKERRQWLCLLLVAGVFICGGASIADGLRYGCSNPPLEATFKIAGGHYNGSVNGGNLLLQTDIPTPPVVRYAEAKPAKLYTLLMIDFDADANGSWPDPVAPGGRAPVRHWIVGNIPGKSLRGEGYVETGSAPSSGITVAMPYRAPHVPCVSDRYGLFLFEQAGSLKFDEMPDGGRRNFDYTGFLKQHGLGSPVASNFFVSMYTSESPFSGKEFHGNDVIQQWHQDLGKGQLVPFDRDISF